MDPISLQFRNMSSVLLWTRSVCEGGCLCDAAIRHQGELFV